MIYFDKQTQSYIKYTAQIALGLMVSLMYNYCYLNINHNNIFNIHINVLKASISNFHSKRYYNIINQI